MSLRIATFNVENLFSRPRAMNLPDWKKGQPYLDDYARLTILLNQETYTAAMKREILDLLHRNGLDVTRPDNPYLDLCKVRGALVQTHNGQTTIVADGRSSWVGWVELKRGPIDDAAILNTARVIAEVDSDILVLVEVEDRPTLQHFHDQVLKPLLVKQGAKPYEYLMVIDGNDERGIDVGIMSRTPIHHMCSHVADRTAKGTPLFSRDCPEYYLAAATTSNGEQIVVLPNHFASKGSDRTGARRRIQAQAVKAIYEQIRETHENVVVAGDFNDYPASGALDPLLKNTDLVDAMSLKAYKGPYPGTYEHATNKEKFDYLLLSPALQKRVTAVDVNRHGFYAPNKWQCFSNIDKNSKNRNQASDHHCLWADLN